jgi:hypothetical protein
MAFTKEMSSRERFITALKRNIPDQVPIFDFTFGKELQKIFIVYKKGWSIKSQIKNPISGGKDREDLHCTRS